MFRFIYFPRIINDTYHILRITFFQTLCHTVFILTDIIWLIAMIIEIIVPRVTEYLEHDFSLGPAVFIYTYFYCVSDQHPMVGHDVILIFLIGKFTYEIM